jgi:hypothetical protein
VDGVSTRRAVASFVERLGEDRARAVFEALPEFSERAAVGWCREIGNFEPKAAVLMPAAAPPLILMKDGVSPRVRDYVLRSYEETRQLFSQEYGITTASRPVLIVAFGRDDLESLLRQPVPGIPDLSPQAAQDTADDLCVGVERVMGAAYRHRIAFCMPPEAQASLTSYDVWKARYHYVMLHEYMHHVQREMSFDKTIMNFDDGPRMGPAWMVEGSAYMAQIKAREGGTRVVSAPMLFALRALDREDPISLSRIRKQDRVASGAEYAASNLATALLSLRYGEESMVAFWRAVGELDDWDAAFEISYGLSLTGFEALFEDLRTDNAKLSQFALAQGAYTQGRLSRTFLGASGIGQAGRGGRALN